MRIDQVRIIAYPHRIACCLIGLAAMLLSAGSAMGQGFLVKPMRLEAEVAPGKSASLTVEFRNTAGEQARALELSLIDVGQSENGAWSILDPNAADKAKAASCRSWVKALPEKIEIPAMGSKELTLQLEAPPSSRGTYVAALLAQAAPVGASNATVRLQIRFMIPIIINIEGRPERQQVELGDVGMMFRKADEHQPATTLLMFNIANEGRTYSRLLGTAKLLYQANGRWKPVSTIDTKELGILPGSHLNLPCDLQRRLPSGKYKISATLNVDGRRVKSLEKEVEFEGDPAVTKLAADTTLTVDPPQMFIASAPGSARTASLKVENNSEDSVDIQATAGIPPTLQGVALGELRGDALSCADWIQLSPAKFTLRPGMKQNVRLTIKMPAGEQSQANYYGQILLHASYPEGDSAGDSTALVCIDNPKVDARYETRAQKVTLSLEQSARYIVQAQFANVGNAYFEPKVSAVLATGNGDALLQTDLAGPEGIMLPLAVRDFSGVFDFAGVNPGTYAIKASLDYGKSKTAADPLLVRVTLEDGHKVVSIVKNDDPGSTEAFKDASVQPGVRQ